VEFDSFGHYSVLKDEAGAPAILGRDSAWGVVHKAFNNDLSCYAALRTISRDAFETEELRVQFVSEVQMAAHIRHPSLVSVFPLEMIGDSYLYATEFCDGETLYERLTREGCLEMSPALSVISPIAAALDEAFSAHLLHRNISAQNVMLLQEDEEISVKVLDLGLPSRRSAAKSSIPPHSCEFSSPEEGAGKEIDVRSGVYSLGALLYYLRAGAGKYALLRAKSLANEEVSFDETSDFSPRVAGILKKALCHDPGGRIATFSELRDAIQEALSEPKRPRAEVIAPPVRVEAIDSAAVTQALPSAESLREARIKEKVPPIVRVERAATPKPQGMVIPSKLLGSAQPGTILRLKREGEAGEQLVAIVRDRFRIGRSATAGADLPTRFLPRDKANDTKTKRLSRIHVTAKCERAQVFLFDGDSITPSANGSTFDGQALSTERPLALLKPSDLRLAEAYSIKVIPRVFEQSTAPAIANLDQWTGPTRESNPLAAGAVVFVPSELSEIRVAVWLFSVAPFGNSAASPIDFALPAGDRETGALRHYRGCFWLEQRTADPVSVGGVVLAPAEIAPLAAGQTLEIGGSKYSVQIDDSSDSQAKEREH
jgi:serine/threonine protein kinase